MATTRAFVPWMFALLPVQAVLTFHVFLLNGSMLINVMPRP
jgi:hypothetical protein